MHMWGVRELSHCDAYFAERGSGERVRDAGSLCFHRPGDTRSCDSRSRTYYCYEGFCDDSQRRASTVFAADGCQAAQDENLWSNLPWDEKEGDHRRRWSAVFLQSLWSLILAVNDKKKESYTHSGAAIIPMGTERHYGGKIVAAIGTPMYLSLRKRQEHLHD